MIDSSDKERMSMTKEELILMMQVFNNIKCSICYIIFIIKIKKEEELKNVPLLVFANK